MGLWSTWVAANGSDQGKRIPTVEFTLQKIDAAVSSLETSFLDLLKTKVYPIGSIYMSSSSTNPGTWITGTTWEQWGSGRVPVGINVNDTNFNYSGRIGGHATHTLLTSQIPDHTHIVMSHHGHVDYGSGDEITDNEDTVVFREGISTDYPSVVTLDQAKIWADNYDPSCTIPTSTYHPGGGSHNNLQPYIVCYMWKRTS